VVGAGFYPTRTLPVVVDVGTNNDELLGSDMYLPLTNPYPQACACGRGAHLRRVQVPGAEPPPAKRAPVPAHHGRVHARSAPALAAGGDPVRGLRDQARGDAAGAVSLSLRPLCLSLSTSLCFSLVLTVSLSACLHAARSATATRTAASTTTSKELPLSPSPVRHRPGESGRQGRWRRNVAVRWPHTPVRRTACESHSRLSSLLSYSTRQPLERPRREVSYWGTRLGTAAGV
jgi:hypothetical protein